MNHSIRSLALCLLAAAGVAATPRFVTAQSMPEVVAAEDPSFNEIAEKRASGIMEKLNLTDADKAARVKQHVVNFTVRLKNAHEGKALPADQKQPALARARDELLAALQAEQLTSEQVDTVKDGLTTNAFNINYDAFVDLIPQLTDEQKAYIRKELAEVRDEAMTLNSGEAKVQMFVKRRGRINNYLSKQGYDLKALSKERNERNAQKRAAATTAPATQPAG